MKSSLMMSLLRILTPEEINELTTTSEGNKRVSLTQLMYLKMGVETSDEVESASVAKILPFTFPDKDEEVASDLEADMATQEPEGAEVVDEVELAEDDIDRQSDSNEKLPTSVFILVEKKRLENTVHKMRSKDLIKSYKKNASIDLEQEKGLRDDMSQSSRSGVLINKKHA